MLRVDEPDDEAALHLFPTEVRTVVATDVDDHAANLTGWKQAYDQLAPGRFEGSLRELWLGPNVQLFEETTSHSVRQSCEVWSGAYWFGIPISAGPHGKIGHWTIEDAAIAVRPGGANFELITPCSFRIFGLVIERQLLLDFIAETEHMLPSATILNQELLNVGYECKLSMQRTLQQVFNLPELRLDHTQARTMLRDSLLSVLTTNCLSKQSAIAQVPTYVGHHRLVRRVRDYALEHQDEPLSIPHLCRTFRVSRRTLQYAFQDVHGISPGAYLRILRLNGVRRALRGPHRSFLNVQDLAAQWGFWHASQFACDYKKLFGERPSETLCRRTG